jgi:hypothetical protein
VPVQDLLDRRDRQVLAVDAQPLGGASREVDEPVGVPEGESEKGSGFTFKLVAGRWSWKITR